MLYTRFATYKFLFKHRFFLGCLAITWITGAIISVYLLSWRTPTEPAQIAIHPEIYEETDSLASNYRMAEAMNYCNPPNSIKRGDEGKKPVNASLEFVAVMLRHGDRGPNVPIRNQTAIDCGTTNSLLLNKYLTTLKQLQGSIKHLAPFTQFPLHPDLKQCTIQQLTLLGAHQHLMVGQALKKSYIEDHKLLAENWTSEDIKLYSTVSSRTFQSAIAFLFGFLPAFDITNIRIIPVVDHTFCMHTDYCQCPLVGEYKSLIKNNNSIFSDLVTFEIIKQLTPIVQHQSNESFYRTSYGMFDALMAYICHATPLPCIPGSDKCATFEHIHSLLTHLELTRKKRLPDSTNKKAAVVEMHGFLQDLIYKINNNINGTDSTRFVLYSGHHLSLMAVLTVLGIYNGSSIPYASYIAFEVYSLTVDNEVKYALKIVYKGRDVTNDVSFCKSPNILFNNSNLCTLENFQEFVEGLIFSIGFNSFDAACNSHVT